MNLKKTQQFLYFQNKARHYANLRTIRPAIKSHRERNHSSTLSDTSRVPYFQRYDMERTNQGLINRITDILSSQKTQIEKHGYTRYNQRSVPKSHLVIQQRKSEVQIDEENHLLANKVLNSKPSIGTIENWNHRFHQIRERKKNISKFTQRRTSKGTLVLDSSTSFIPEHYKSFLHTSIPRKDHQMSLQSPQELPIKMKIRIEQLFQLPKLQRLRGSSTRIGEEQNIYV